MKKLLATLLLLTPIIALAGPPDAFIRREWTEAQALTRAAPTLATQGVSLQDAVSVMVVLKADSGQTLSGGGSVVLYFYDKFDGTNWEWARFPARKITDLSGCAGLRTCILEAFTLDGPRYSQRLLPAASAVTVSSGTVTMIALVTVSGKSSSR